MSNFMRVIKFGIFLLNNTKESLKRTNRPIYTWKDSEPVVKFKNLQNNMYNIIAFMFLKIPTGIHVHINMNTHTHRKRTGRIKIRPLGGVTSGMGRKVGEKKGDFNILIYILQYSTNISKAYLYYSCN